MERDFNKRLAIFKIKQMRRLRRELNAQQEAFFEKIENQQRQFFADQGKEKSLNDYLTVKELTEEFNISLSTFKRYRDQGLNTYQNGYKGRISIRKGDYIEFLNNRELW